MDNNRYIKPVYQLIASLIVAYKNCEASHNLIWLNRHSQKIRHIFDSLEGAGFKFYYELDKSKENKIIFYGNYHKMNDTGYYDGYDNFKVIMTPDFINGFSLRIISTDSKIKSEDREYYYDYLYNALSEKIDESKI